MIKLECLDEHKRLWSVTDLLSEDLVHDILAFDWPNAEYEKGNLDYRRQIRITGQIERFDQAVLQRLPEINFLMGTDFKTMFGQWWLDLEGFWCSLHTDGHLPNSMQIYWLSPGLEYGTGFYYYKSKDKLKHQFLSKANTGYIMLNHLEPDGSQPLQWHAMMNKVPLGGWRLSSYHIMQ